LRRIAVVTGTRSEYGLFRPVLDAIDSHPELESLLVVTGMHLSPRYGETVREIEAEREVAARIPMDVEEDSGAGMARSIGQGISGLSDCFEELCPDIVLLLGDRGEPFAAAVAAAHQLICVAHIHGGDVSGGVDESVRHALTRLAHLHFAASPRSRDRLLAMGERKETVHCVGAPGLDYILGAQHASSEEVRAFLGFEEKVAPLLLALHPETWAPEKAGEQMRQVLDVALSVEYPLVVIHPNSDAGRTPMVREIERCFAEGEEKRFCHFATLPHPVYLGLLREARAMLGNSSSGLIEAPSFGLPVVNVGGRQRGRERGENVIDVPFETGTLREALDRALHDGAFRERVSKGKNPYGDGRAGTRIAQVLSKVALTPDLLQKKLEWS
jgi:UDP-N-acetylglucosamine 2-epimerase (non-hydrolysing)/GDP/UDP-N,N'-diacetylbacillosamine 2-epimerase (hydrolysing)